MDPLTTTPMTQAVLPFWLLNANPPLPVSSNTTHSLFLLDNTTISQVWIQAHKLTISPNFRKYTNIHLQIHFYIIYACILFIYIYTYVLVDQSCPSLHDPMDCSLPGSSVHGIFQERTLEWVANVYFRRSSRPRDGTHGSCLSCFRRQIMYHCATWGAHIYVHKPVYMHIYIHIYQIP